MARTKNSPSPKQPRGYVAMKGNAIAKKHLLEKPKKRFRPGTVALREIRKYQKSTEHVLPLAPFRRLVREIINDVRPDLRMTTGSVDALREAAEVYMCTIFEESQLLAIHGRRVTVMPKDMQLCLRLRGPAH